MSPNPCITCTYAHVYACSDCEKPKEHYDSVKGKTELMLEKLRHICEQQTRERGTCHDCPLYYFCNQEAAEDNICMSKRVKWMVEKELKMAERKRRA